MRPLDPILPSSRSFLVIPGHSQCLPAPLSHRGYSRDAEGSWFRSLFVHKVDPRKDAHSNLLSKKETSNLYKIQCECSCGEEGRHRWGAPLTPWDPRSRILPLPSLLPSPSLLSLQFTM